MEKAILLLHLILVVFLIVLVLLQRSEGGALGMGGGGGGVVTGRSATTALQRVTWYLAIGFLATSLTLTVIAQSGRQSGSVLDGVPVEASGPVPDEAPQGDTESILDALSPAVGEGSAPASDDLLTPPAE